METKREPSIHITERELANILRELPEVKGYPRDLAKKILRMSKEHSLTRRKMLATNKKDTQRAEKVVSASIQDTIMLGNLIYQYRKSLKHRGITPIKAGTSQYSVLKTVTKLANEFFESYPENLTSKKEAYMKYIQLAIELMPKNFNITRIPSLNEKIVNNYEADWSVKNDKNSDTTSRVYQNYVLEVIQRVGALLDDPKDNPQEMAYMVEAAQRCIDNRINPRVYVLSQFHGLEWCNGIPTPAQLVGKNSWKYYQNYRLTHGEEIAKETVDNTKINRLKNILSNEK